MFWHQFGASFWADAANTLIGVSVLLFAQWVQRRRVERLLRNPGPARPRPREIPPMQFVHRYVCKGCGGEVEQSWETVDERNARKALQ